MDCMGLIQCTHLNRDFIHNSYSELKKANPKFPFLVRECSGVKPKLIARYGKHPILPANL